MSGEPIRRIRQIGKTQTMSNYRRNRVPDGTYFFTMNLLDRKSMLLIEHIAKLRGDEKDYAAYVDYIHDNPVKHGWARAVKKWPYSSFRRMVKAGIYPSNWTCLLDSFEVGEWEN